MEQIINQMLAKYEINNNEDRVNALKEVIQEAVLCGLSRAGFFKEVAFYGGTALRIFYGLDRFSEDLDFSLMKPNLEFDMSKYFSVLEQELQSLGLSLKIEEKVKSPNSTIRSAFLKGSTKENILTFYSNNGAIGNIGAKDLIKVKFEVDVNPPEYATYEMKYGLLPSPYQVRLYDSPSLFAGKLHAVICRAWKNRIKGRDLYDYLFYLSRGTKVNLSHLKARLVESNYIQEEYDLSIETLKGLLTDRFDTIDFNQAKDDVLPFIRDKKSLDVWSKEFFIAVTQGLK
jgi:predicted nucleotidyltransferase component of viral defense system